MREESFERMGEIGILVRNLDEALEKFKSYGFAGPWREFYTDAENMTEIMIDGRPSDKAGFRCAMCDYGLMTLELVQPVDIDTDMSRTLDKYGPVVHHIMFRTKPAWYEVVKEKNIQEVMSAYFPRIDEHGRWFDTRKDLGFDIYAWDPNPKHKNLKYPEDYIAKGAYKTER